MANPKMTSFLARIRGTSHPPNRCARYKMQATGIKKSNVTMPVMVRRYFSR